MKKGKLTKAQAAMQFLMTYGWVIFLVIIIIGAMTYFGVFDISRLIPSKCEIGSGFECKDYMIRENAIILQIENKAGTGLYISKLNFTRNNAELCHWTGAYFMEPGEIHEWIRSCPVGTSIQKQSLGVEVEYYKSPMSKHLAYGALTNIVEGVQPALSNEEICRIADEGDDDGICCALDIYFGPGYMNECCQAPPKDYCCDVHC